MLCEGKWQKGKHFLQEKKIFSSLPPFAFIFFYRNLKFVEMVVLIQRKFSHNLNYFLFYLHCLRLIGGEKQALTQISIKFRVKNLSIFGNNILIFNLRHLKWVVSFIRVLTWLNSLISNIFHGCCSLKHKIKVHQVFRHLTNNFGRRFSLKVEERQGLTITKVQQSSGL